MAENLKEPSWLMAAVDQRVALMMDKTGGVFPENTVVSTPLTEPEDGDFDRWDRACDNCNRFIPQGEDMHTGHAFREIDAPDGTKTKIIINFGMCTACKALP